MRDIRCFPRFALPVRYPNLICLCFAIPCGTVPAQPLFLTVLDRHALAALRVEWSFPALPCPRNARLYHYNAKSCQAIPSHRITIRTLAGAMRFHSQQCLAFPVLNNAVPLVELPVPVMVCYVLPFRRPVPCRLALPMPCQAKPCHCAPSRNNAMPVQSTHRPDWLFHRIFLFNSPCPCSVEPCPVPLRQCYVSPRSDLPPHCRDMPRHCSSLWRSALPTQHLRSSSLPTQNCVMPCPSCTSSHDTLPMPGPVLLYDNEP